METRASIDRNHPLRQLFRSALEYGFELNPTDKSGVADYIEEHILCEFIQSDNMYKIRDASGKSLEDIGDMLAEGNVLLNAQSFEREFQVHKHIGDYTLFMLGMFPAALTSKRGKEFVLSSVVVPGANLSDHYMLQGRHSYRIASEFFHKDLFLELSSNFEQYQAVIEFVRTYLETEKSSDIFNHLN